MTPVPTVLKEIEERLGKLPKYMGFDAGYHSAAIAHLPEKNHVTGVIGCRRHTHAKDTFGKYRFIYDFEHDCYICPAKHRLYWKTTNREGFRGLSYFQHNLAKKKLMLISAQTYTLNQHPAAPRTRAGNEAKNQTKEIFARAKNLCTFLPFLRINKRNGSGKHRSQKAKEENTMWPY